MKKLLLLTLIVFGMQFAFSQAPMNIANKSLPVEYETVENQPIYPGGLNEFVKFIGKNFHTPEVEGLSGVMKVTFVIETNGSVSDIKVLNDLGSGSGEEAKRVLQMCPKWTPGDQAGKPVRVLYTLPITIRN